MARSAESVNPHNHGSNSVRLKQTATDSHLEKVARKFNAMWSSNKSVTNFPLIDKKPHIPQTHVANAGGHTGKKMRRGLKIKQPVEMRRSATERCHNCRGNSRFLWRGLEFLRLKRIQMHAPAERVALRIVATLQTNSNSQDGLLDEDIAGSLHTS